MSDDLTPALTVDVLAASLSLDRADSQTLLKQLAQKFQLFLPSNTRVKRRWLGLGPIETVTLCFDDYHYQVSQERYGAIAHRRIKFVRSVAIKTTEMDAQEWNLQVAEALARLAQQSADMRHALQQFIG